MTVPVLVLALMAPAFAAADPPAAPAGGTPAVETTEAAAAHERPHLIGDLLGDFKDYVTSPGNALWMAAAGAATLAAHQVDRRTTAAFGGDAGLHDAFAPGGTIGNGFTEIGAAAGLYGLGLAAHHARLARVGEELLRADLVAGAVTDVIKIAAQRTRPDGGNFSFPSGHTSVTFASAMVIDREFGWKAGVPALAVASYVAASRVQGLHHYLSDVAFGAAIGLTAGRTVTIRARGLRMTLSPAVVPGGVGVLFTTAGR
ncbi:MAG: phosphatase PAP2 family protein [Acidobacteriota bacterium]|nr:phosphatase PAP2 family protein [Acidobacteriota bacterium]